MVASVFEILCFGMMQPLRLALCNQPPNAGVAPVPRLRLVGSVRDRCAHSNRIPLTGKVGISATAALLGESLASRGGLPRKTTICYTNATAGRRPAGLPLSP